MFLEKGCPRVACKSTTTIEFVFEIWLGFAKIIMALFGLFRPTAFAKPYAWPPTILINEFDAGIL